MTSSTAVGPDQWKDTSSHAPMRGDLAHLHEARDRHGQTLYRLYLYWQRTERRVVLLDGRTKPNQTALTDAEYEAVRKLSELADRDPPAFAVVDDFAQMVLG
jgi:hypothetical protein